MVDSFRAPQAAGQLVWCPADPALGVGLVTRVEGKLLHVRFVRLQEDRVYTTRGEQVLARYTVRSGERVLDSAGAECRVERRGEPQGALETYALEDGRTVSEDQLVPSVRDIGAKVRLASLNLAHPAVLRTRMQGLALASIWPRPGVAGVLGARAMWLPHQIDVACRAIASDPVRMLLADEVGLGKTVEATLIYAGLRCEGRAQRVLVLTPAQLTIQWLGEIFRKAHELMVLLDAARIQDARADFPDLSPFDAHQRMVIAIDDLMGDAALAAEVAQASWDLVIIDEAHHLRWSEKAGGNPGYRLAEALARRSRHLLLLTATPMALDPSEYHALLRLLDPSRFDDPAFFESVGVRLQSIRDLGRAVEEALRGGTALPKRVLAQGAAILGDDEADGAAWQALVSAPPKDAQRRAHADAVLAALQLRHGFAHFVVRNRRGPVGGMPARKAETHPLEPTPAQQDLLDVGEAVMFEVARTIEEPRERNATLGKLLRALWATPRALTDILRPLSPSLAAELAPYVAKVVGAPNDATGLPTGDARLRWLVQLLRRLPPGDKILVFVETDIAVRALRDALASHVGNNIAVFHRGLAPRDQDRQVAWFRDLAGPAVMLSTEAGGEGRNFQFCHRVVLYDMPWRPATVEQRIGRVDRVGQRHDVQVLVPHLRSGYEAAIVKVMQQAIGVLEETVGGIDHALEFTSDRLAELILTQAEAEAWKALYRETHELITQTRSRIEDAVDPILDHASFSSERVAKILARVPANFEAGMETFVRGYADHNRIEMQAKTSPVIAIDGAPSAAGGAEPAQAYVGTFARAHAIDHEDVEFLSFGHPLVEDALRWARDSQEASAAVAVCRGFPNDGAAFLWRFGIDLPEDVPEARAYVDQHLVTIALDEAGTRQPELEDLFEAERALDRMDVAPLQQAAQRWRRLVDGNHDCAEAMAAETFQGVCVGARDRMAQAFTARRRWLNQQHTREVQQLKSAAARRERELLLQSALAQLDEQHQRIDQCLAQARPQLVGAMAIRLMRAKRVSV